MEAISEAGLNVIWETLPEEFRQGGSSGCMLRALGEIAAASGESRRGDPEELPCPIPAMFGLILPTLCGLATALAQNKQLMEQVASLTIRVARLEGVETGEPAKA